MSLRKIINRNVVTILSNATVQDAAVRMREYHVSNVIVIRSENQNRVPIGILTDRDIVLSAVALGVDPTSITVEEIMAPSLIKAYVNDSLFHVMNLMKDQGVKRVIVVSPDGSLEGIISSEDILSLLSAELNDVTRIKLAQKKIEIERRRKFA